MTTKLPKFSNFMYLNSLDQNGIKIPISSVGFAIKERIPRVVLYNIFYLFFFEYLYF